MLHIAEHFEASDTGRQRRENEDSFFARGRLFVVADGMGGAQAGEVASSIAAEAFAAGLPSDGSSEERLATRVLEANSRIHELSRTDRERAGMGTTLTAVYLDGDELAIAHVGDSRAYLWRDGELTRLTRDHSLVDELVRRGRLTEEEAAEHPQRSIITRALGPEPQVEVDTQTHRAQAGDVLLLCSDGLTAMVAEPRVAELLGDAASLAAAGRALIEEANAAGGRDNITVLLFRLGDGEEPPPAAPAAADQTQELRAAGTAIATPELTTAVRRPPPGLSRRERREFRAQRAAASAAARRIPGPKEREHAPLPLKVKLLGGTTATVLVLAILVFAGWLATRGVFFVGTNKDGLVTIYRGLPWDLPANVNLYEKYYISGVPASEVPAARRSTLLNHQLRSQKDASSLLNQLELGKLSP